MKIGSGWKKSYTDKETSAEVGFVGIAIDAIPLDALKTGTLNITVFNVKEKRSDNSPDYDVVWSKPRSGGSFGDAGNSGDSGTPGF